MTHQTIADLPSIMILTEPTAWNWHKVLTMDWTIAASLPEPTELLLIS